MVDLGPLDGPAFDILDPRFAACTVPGARVERIWTGSRWTEGPAWLAAPGLLVWSDIPGDRMLAWEQATGRISTFRQPANSPNGNTVDREGRLVTCEQAPHRIARAEADGTIWFSDPSYGRAKTRGEGPDVQGCHVYRFDPAAGVVRRMTDDFVMPNGLAFSPDESLLYIAARACRQPDLRRRRPRHPHDHGDQLGLCLPVERCRRRALSRRRRCGRNIRPGAALTPVQRRHINRLI